MLIYLDIETLPGRSDALMEALRADAQSPPGARSGSVPRTKNDTKKKKTQACMFCLFCPFCQPFFGLVATERALL